MCGSFSYANDEIARPSRRGGGQQPAALVLFETQPVRTGHRLRTAGPGSEPRLYGRRQLWIIAQAFGKCHVRQAEVMLVQELAQRTQPLHFRGAIQAVPTACPWRND